MLTRQEQLLANEPLTGAQTLVTKQIAYGQEVGWVVVVRALSATGTSPTLIATLQQVQISTGTVTSATAALTTLTGVAGAQVAVAVSLSSGTTGTTTINNSASANPTQYLQVQLVVGGTTPVFPNVFVDLIALN